MDCSSGVPESCDGYVMAGQAMGAADVPPVALRPPVDAPPVADLPPVLWLPPVDADPPVPGAGIGTHAWQLYPIMVAVAPPVAIAAIAAIGCEREQPSRMNAKSVRVRFVMVSRASQ